MMAMTISPRWFHTSRIAVLRWMLVLAVMTASLGASAELARASDLYILSAFNSTFPDPNIIVQLNSQYGSNVSGWSITLCHDPSAIVLNDVAFGPALLDLGAPPDFHDVAFFGGGFTTNCIIDNGGNLSLLPAEDHYLYVIDYDWIPNGNGYSDILFCPTSPSGGGLDSYISSGGQAYDPISIDTFVFNGFIDPGVIYAIPRTVGTYDEQTGDGSVVVEPRIIPALFGLDSVSGFSMAVSHDQTLLQIESVIAWGAIADLNGGTGPDLMLVELLPDGWTVDVTFGPTGTETVNFLSSICPLQAAYSTQGGAIPSGSCVGSWLRFDGSLGVFNEVNYFPFGPIGAYRMDELAILVPTTASFQRGDCNGDSARNLADAIFNLAMLFSGGGPAPCDDACDHNDDGSLDISDAIYLLTYLFNSGPELPEPNLLCGSDPTTDGIGCANNTCP